ncbi:permease for cytosine/purines, uracil, thiamine, allantoin-domain-containing protein [Pseudomassariella vexata]|uniref:Permease for cytosine/purines, uracil, thiamine, allantoin-domain-containing protein n=1 Tax=Pseudomassariella vexata TaxID=1141098 RepID=A0A1Y2E272_9PEZI|nr:permease for cytosine/purines, uracil, thiamine, allantoin-domain-containing protein [Pseudomassariella vexata]ORY65444.1 permease for cytosine/purines, uracil, thiamine, allantoin-domain-containing protein [Pseudomassariella vexata]
MVRTNLDEEKAGYTAPTVTDDATSDYVPAHLRQAPDTGILGKLRGFEEALDRKLGVESHGIARKLPEERDPAYAKWSNQLVMFALWASGTMNLSCFATGFLGWELGIDLRRSILLIVFGTLVGSAVTGWCATMGAPTGLRQVSIFRYSLGWWPTKFLAVFNVVEQIGWSSVGSITGGLALAAVSDGKIGSELGVIIVAVAGFIMSFLGLKVVFQYEKFAWLVFLVIFAVMYGETAKFGNLEAPATAEGSTFSGVALTLFGVVYGSSASWASIVSDFYVEYPVNTPKIKVFVLTTLGICVPTCIGMLLGAVVASALPGNDDWSTQYDSGIGFLVQTMIYPHGFAKFILFLLVLSGVGMNSIAIYSAGLSIQQFARPLAVVPRFIWTSICFVAIILLGLAGRDQLLVYLENFLSLIGYFTTSFFVCLIVEHYLFRRGSYENYDLDAWNDPKRMPIGFAGGVAFACGIVGAVLGMQTTWYTGVLALMIGDFGGDIANELAFLFTLIVYIPARYLELKVVGR